MGAEFAEKIIFRAHSDDYQGVRKFLPDSDKKKYKKILPN
jgi:hypothetical protein